MSAPDRPFTVDVDDADPSATTLGAVGTGVRKPPGWPHVAGTVREYVHADSPEQALVRAVGYVLARRRTVPADDAGAARFAAADRAATERAS